MSQTTIIKHGYTPEEIEYQIYYSYRVGLYKVAEKALQRRERFIYKNIEKFKGKTWLHSWLADNLLRGQKVSKRYRLVIEDILENKYKINYHLSKAV